MPPWPKSNRLQMAHPKILPHPHRGTEEYNFEEIPHPYLPHTPHRTGNPKRATEDKTQPSSVCENGIKFNQNLRHLDPTLTYLRISSYPKHSFHHHSHGCLQAWTRREGNQSQLLSQIAVAEAAAAAATVTTTMTPSAVVVTPSDSNCGGSQRRVTWNT